MDRLDLRQPAPLLRHVRGTASGELIYIYGYSSCLWIYTHYIPGIKYGIALELSIYTYMLLDLAWSDGHDRPPIDCAPGRANNG